MSSLPLNIVNSKSLEKQLKVVETRIGELQTEIRDLEKIKTACQVLLGSPADFGETAPTESVEAASAKPSTKKKTEKKLSEETPEDFAPPASEIPSASDESVASESLS